MLASMRGRLVGWWVWMGRRKWGRSVERMRWKGVEWVKLTAEAEKNKNDISFQLFQFLVT